MLTCYISNYKKNTSCIYIKSPNKDQSDADLLPCLMVSDHPEDPDHLGQGSLRGDVIAWHNYLPQGLRDGGKGIGKRSKRREAGSMDPPDNNNTIHCSIPLIKALKVLKGEIRNGSTNCSVDVAVCCG